MFGEKIRKVDCSSHFHKIHKLFRGQFLYPEVSYAHVAQFTAAFAVYHRKRCRAVYMHNGFKCLAPASGQLCEPYGLR